MQSRPPDNSMTSLWRQIDLRYGNALHVASEREFTGTKEEVDIRRRGILSREHFVPGLFTCGSRGEGFYRLSSDIDLMIVDSNVAVLYPNQPIPRNMANKTIFNIREAADSRPGYVHLELKQVGQGLSKQLRESLVVFGNSMFLSSDIYRETHVNEFSECVSQTMESNGPSCTIHLSGGTCTADRVQYFSCHSWPKEANEWRTRARLHGWPCQTLIDEIVGSGFSLVPVGDKCTQDTLLQWRISFAKSERSLVHSFTYIQFKVYALLKYFLKQIKGTLADTVGDDDILCSYFLKTILFHAIENTSQTFWQEKNCFYCFWFCINILIAWVRAGFCPSYFIPANNLFKRKIHGQNQQILLDVLINYYQMKWLCLSVGNHYPPIWYYLRNSANQAELACPKIAQDIVLGQDIEMMRSSCYAQVVVNAISPRKALDVLSTSQSDIDEVFAYHHVIGYLARNAANQAFDDHTVATDNKTRYRSLRKCIRWMSPRSSMGTELLYLATLQFLLGNIGKALDMCKQATKLAPSFIILIVCGGTFTLAKGALEHAGVLDTYWNRQSGEIFGRLQTMYTSPIEFYPLRFNLPHLCLDKTTCYVSQPLPYALFLTFLCCHELGDTRGREAALRHLVEVKGDVIHGGQGYWIIPIFLGICYQMIGDNHRAIRAYWDSARFNPIYDGRNLAIKRIAVVYLCMYASKRFGRK